MKPIIWWTVAILFGLVLIAGAVSKGLTPEEPSIVYCGSDVMSPGDTCEQTRNGSKKDYSYDDMKSEATTGDVAGSWASLIGGGVLVVLGSVKLVAAVRRRGAGGSGPGAPVAPQQWAAQQQSPYPPQPYQPQPPQQPQNFGPRGH